MTGPYVRFDLERVLKGSCSQNKQTKGEKPLVCRVLPGFAFAFVFWAVGSGLWARGLWFALGWALGSAGWVVLIKVSWWPYIRILIETV